MGGMDCCKAALINDQNVQFSIARLCCALNCSNEGTVPDGVRFTSQLQLTIITYPPIAQALVTSQLRTRRLVSFHGPPRDSHPAYILNLALLI